MHLRAWASGAATPPRLAPVAFLALVAALFGAACKGGSPGSASSTASPAPGPATSAHAHRPRAGVSASAVVPAPLLKVPVTHATFKLDGELSEPEWNALAARTHAFVATPGGGEARPYSEARFLWDDQNLYVALYAADDDLRAAVTQHDGPVWTDDSFALELRAEEPPNGPTYHFDLSPSGVVTDAKRVPGGKDDVSWESGIKLGVDRDGTLNDPADMDEEWVVEAAIPLAAMGISPKAGTRIVVTISRCDTPRGTKDRRCGAWGTASAPRVLELGG